MLNENAFSHQIMCLAKQMKRSTNSTHPERTPSTKLSMKKDPSTIRGTKYKKLKELPRESLVWKKYVYTLGHDMNYLNM